MTADVYGLQRDLPLNYVNRKAVDEKLINSLRQGKHLVIYGSSKQGKTSLRRSCLKESDYILVQCMSSWNLEDLHAAILKQAGYEIRQSVSKTVTGKNKLMATAKALLPLIGEASGRVESEKATSTTTTIAPLELDAEDPNDVAKALKSFNQMIVLEDFHYLPIETQRAFASALKAFHELSSTLCFLIVGVWLEEGRLTAYNGDLNGRVIPINADLWSRDELRQVIGDGAALLNVTFDPAFVEDLLANCFDSVYLVQEVCNRACEQSGVFKTLEHMKVVGDGLDAKTLVKDVVADQGGRYTAFVTQFAAGFQDTALEMYKWLLYPVLTASVSELEKGLTQKHIRKTIEAHHPAGRGLNPGNVTQALQACAALQVKKNIRPI